MAVLFPEVPPSVDVTVLIGKRKRKELQQSQQDEATSEPATKCQVVTDIDHNLLMTLRDHAKQMHSSPASLDEKRQHLAFMNEILKLQRKIHTIYKNSIHICVEVATLEALVDLYQKCVTGSLKRAFYAEFITAEFLEKCGLESVDICIEIDRTEYQRLRTLLEGEQWMSTFDVQLTAQLNTSLTLTCSLSTYQGH